MTGAPAFHPFLGDDGQQIGWQSADGATVVALDQLPPGAAGAGSASPPAAPPPRSGNLLDFFAGNQAQAAPSQLPPGFDTPVPYEAKGKGSALPPGFDTPVPYAESKAGKNAEAKKQEPDRGWLGSINDVVGGVADAAAMAVPFADEMGAGVRAGARGVTNLIQGKDADLGGTYDRALEDIRGRGKQFSQEHPYLATAGGVGGGLAVLPGAATARSLPATIARSAATGAGYGGVSGFAAGEGGVDNRLQSAGQGALYGGVLGAGVPLAAPVAARIISPVRNRLTAEQQRLAGVAATEGIPLTAAQATGSRPLNSTESVFSTLPMTAGPQQATQQAQRSAFNQAALRHIGETGDSLAPDVLLRARQRIGGQIENLVAQTTVAPDQQFAQDLGATVAQYSRRLDSMRRPVFDNFVSDIRDMMNAGGMPGATYQSTRSTLSEMAQGGSDPYFARALRSLRDILDKAADRAMPQHLKGDWAEARRLYGNLRTLEKAMSNTTTQAAAGNLQPTPFSHAVKQQGPMKDLEAVGRTFIRDQVPNSGTPERAFITSLLTGAPGLAGGTTAYMANPLAGAAVGVGGLVLPRAAQGLYNSRLGQAWLKNQRTANTVPQINQGLLQAVLAGSAGGGLLGQ